MQEVIYDLYHMQVVGWYHSHPTFPALPSIIDIRNQLMFQRNAQDPSTGYEPYIAAIVSPYDKRLPTLQSAVTWFCVGYDHSRQIAMDKDMIEQVMDQAGTPSLATPCSSTTCACTIQLASAPCTVYS